MKNAAVYVRISQDRTEAGLGVGRQLADCRKWAQDNGVQVAEVYEDNDISAYGGKVRPAYRQLCSDLRDGVRDGVIVWKPDRLHRSPRELEDFIDIMESTGAEYVSVLGGNWDLSTSSGRTIARILGAVARQESDDKSERISRKHLELAQQGKPKGGGSRGFGYTIDYKVIPAEAVVVKELAKRVLAGEALGALCRELDARGVSTVKGGKWRATSLKDLLISHRIAGLRVHRGNVVGKAQWEPIISVHESARLRTLLTDPARRSTRPPRSYFLTGLVVCGRCGSPMTGVAHMQARSKAKARGEKTRRYICVSGSSRKGCGGTMISADRLEEFISESIFDVLDSAEAIVALNAGGSNLVDAEVAQKELEDDFLQLDEFATMLGQRDLTPQEWKAATAPVKARIAENEKRLAAVEGPLPAIDPKARENWATYPAPRRRAIVAAYAETITIGPGTNTGPKFDRGRISVKESAPLVGHLGEDEEGRVALRDPQALRMMLALFAAIPVGA